MTQNILIEIVKIAPSLLNTLLLVAIAVVLKKPFVNDLLPKITEFKGLGVEIKLIESKIKEVEAKRAHGKYIDYDLTVLERIHNNSRLVEHRKILWIDDHISRIKDEVEILRSFGIHVDISTNSGEGLEKMQAFPYDLIISDIDRLVHGESGLRFLKEKVDMNIATPLVFFINNYEPEKGTPANAFGITNRFDELLHLMVDCFERSNNKGRKQ